MPDTRPSDQLTASRPVVQPSVCCFLFDSMTGGPTVRVGDVYPVLLAEGCDVWVAMPKRDGTAKSYLEERGIVVEELRIRKPTPPSKPLAFLAFLLSSPLALARVYFYLRARKPDIVHVNGIYDFLPALAARFSGAKVAWHLNDMLWSRKTSHKLGKFARKVAHAVIASSEATADHYGIPPDEAVIIHPPINTARYRPLDAAARFERAQQRKPVVALIGNWNPLKGHPDFVAIVKRLDENGLPVRARMIGRLLDTQAPYWRPIVAGFDSYRGGAEFDVAGFSSDIAGELEDVDLVVITSKSEAGPIVALETMASAIPIVSYDVGAMRQFLATGEANESGAVLAHGDIAGMSEAIADLLGNKTRYVQSAENALSRVTNKFDLYVSVEAHRRVYARLARQE